MGRVVSEKAIVNGVVGLFGHRRVDQPHPTSGGGGAGGGNRDHLGRLRRLSSVTPLIARVYPNGSGDVNHFHAAGGMAFVVRQLLDAGLAHGDVITVAGPGGLRRYQDEPFLDGDVLVWREGRAVSLDLDMLRPVDDPFDAEGGIRLLTGNLGRR